MKTKKLIILGAAGFIGTELTLFLASSKAYSVIYLIDIYKPKGKLVNAAKTLDCKIIFIESNVVDSDYLALLDLKSSDSIKIIKPAKALNSCLEESQKTVACS